MAARHHGAGGWCCTRCLPSCRPYCGSSAGIPYPAWPWTDGGRHPAPACWPSRGRPASGGIRVSAVEATTFEHQACVYGSDRQFLEMALPLLETGLANGEPVLAVTTPANLELISAALGVRAGDVDYAESAFFGRRPPQRIAAFHRYSQRHAPGRDGT